MLVEGRNLNRDVTTLSRSGGGGPSGSFSGVAVGSGSSGPVHLVFRLVLLRRIRLLWVLLPPERANDVGLYR